AGARPPGAESHRSSRRSKKGMHREFCKADIANLNQKIKKEKEKEKRKLRKKSNKLQAWKWIKVVPICSCLHYTSSSRRLGSRCSLKAFWGVFEASFPPVAQRQH